MKVIRIAIISLAFFTSLTFFNNESMAAESESSSFSSRGVRVGLVKPFLKADVKSTSNGVSVESTDSIDEALGFSVGYVSIPLRELGWTTSLSYIDIKDEGGALSTIRLDGNLAFAVMKFLNFKGGLNLSNLKIDSINKTSAFGLGFQAIIGFQLSNRFGIDIGYTQMNQSLKIDKELINFKHYGVELGINGTF